MYESKKVILSLDSDQIETIISVLVDRYISAELCKESAYREIADLKASIALKDQQMCQMINHMSAYNSADAEEGEYVNE